MSTWLPLEYDLQFHYGREQVQFSPYLRKFKTALDDMTREKIRAAGEGKEQRPEKERSRNEDRSLLRCCRGR